MICICAAPAGRVMQSERGVLLREAADDVLLLVVDNAESTRISAAPAAGATLTLDDVRGADFSDVTPLAVLGWPIRHSVSPQMHNAALSLLAEADPSFALWRYYRVEVRPEELKEALPLLLEKGFKGLNLTVPHKVLAMELADVRDDTAHACGAVNTLRNWNGSWLGYNTDGAGFATAAASVLQEKIAGRDVVVLGAGGAARAICAISVFMGCRSLRVGNRTPSRLAQLFAQLAPVNLARGDRLVPLSGFELAKACEADLPESALVVNATSLGLKPEDAAPIDLSLFGEGTKVFDTTYGRHRSALIRQAESLGMPACNGLKMLVGQGHLSLFKVWLGSLSRLDAAGGMRAMEDAAAEALGLNLS